MEKTDSYADGMTQRAFAKSINLSEVQVRRLVKKGVLKTDSNGRISAKGGAEAYAGYKAAYQGKGRKPEKARAAVEAVARIASEGSEDFQRLYESWLAGVEVDPVGVLNSARAYAQALATRQEKLKLDEQEGRLFSRERCEADARAAGAQVRARLLTVPARAATLCEGRTARDIEEIIEREINGALEGLQKLFAS